MSVAIVMPETGLEELPISPQMREETVTKRNPNKATNSEAETSPASLPVRPAQV